jgi:lipopolysaccharide biosynthesis glycosyltransferase
MKLFTKHYAKNPPSVHAIAHDEQMKQLSACLETKIAAIEAGEKRMRDLMIRQAELSAFFDIMAELRNPQPAHNLPRDRGRRIPIFLASDDNYVPFIGVVIASILANTRSFIEFYVLETRITNANKEKMTAFVKTFPHASIEFISVDEKTYWGNFKMPDNYRLPLATCNRLLIPALKPDIKRAIYLDLDIIAMDDIADLYEYDLGGHIFGAVPFFCVRSILSKFEQMAQISKDFKYLNSGVLLIDCEKWREAENGNDGVVRAMQSYLHRLAPNGIPDEVVLNNYCMTHPYKRLPFRYNVHNNEAYKYQKKRKDQGGMDVYGPYSQDELDYYFADAPICIRHFVGPVKPWNTLSIGPEKYIHEFEDFWKYARLSPCFSEIKQMFLESRMPLP